MDHAGTKGRALLGALVSGVLAAGAVTAAPTADADCFSFLGVGNGNGCTSGPTSYAVAIGEGAVADASTVLFGGALAIGANASSINSLGIFNFTTAIGDNASANSALSLFGHALQVGPGNSAILLGLLAFAFGVGPQSDAATMGIGNVSLQIGSGTSAVIGALNVSVAITPGSGGQQTTTAGLFGTVAVNFLPTGGAEVATSGFFSAAWNILSSGKVLAEGFFNAALKVLGITLLPLSEVFNPSSSQVLASTPAVETVALPIADTGINIDAPQVGEEPSVAAAAPTADSVDDTSDATDTDGDSVAETETETEVDTETEAEVEVEAVPEVETEAEAETKADAVTEAAAADADEKKNKPNDQGEDKSGQKAAADASEKYKKTNRGQRDKKTDTADTGRKNESSNDRDPSDSDKSADARRHRTAATG